MQKNGEGRMDFMDLYKPENVMLLAKLTDKALAMISTRKSDPSLDEIDVVRKQLFKKQSDVLAE
jgi:hypothetical protein